MPPTQDPTLVIHLDVYQVSPTIQLPSWTPCKTQSQPYHGPLVKAMGKSDARK